jgi:hypothetical protein
MKQRKGKFRSGIVVVLVAAGITASAAQGRVLLSGGGVDAKSYPEIRSESRAKGIELRSFTTSPQYGEIRSESLSKLQSAAQGRVAKGIEFRTFATPQQYGEIRSESLSKLQSGQTLGALAVRSEGMNRLYGQTQSGPNAVVSTTDSGFSWSDAGIGAGVAFGSAMLVGAAALSRRRQTHVAV